MRFKIKDFNPQKNIREKVKFVQRRPLFKKANKQKVEDIIARLDVLANGRLLRNDINWRKARQNVIFHKIRPP